ncbi:FAD-dependent monooxygenase [Streptomyces prasinopilosus]|uniref:2-polyprenyl-6-methoxyphenol hydroxylase n=1 Tax=Streptomyces prasinopilosus TaxID=67344 RepID=A0A1G6LBM7_9ACTN|nr:FAD-dependent monooxygenase [Streptomyces prasinopilosus]SDC40680.1 2-polyprenyl-6-methoxyphenol hydroxylase [Streptomyces prasinopilosus]
MDDPLTTPVAVVGGGPVGLMLALFLDRQEVPCVVLNSQQDVPDRPRGSTHNARTMEHYRTLGLAERVRGLGLPAGHSAGISFFTRYNAHELALLPWPGTAEVLSRRSAADRAEPAPEPMHRANQMYVERLLLDHARTRPRITLCFGWTVTALRESEAHVDVTAERDGVRRTFRAAYVAGCDGGHSLVRRHLGIRYEGEGTLDQDILGRRSTAAHLRVPTLYRDFLRGRGAWSNWVVNADLALNLIALNGVDEFFLLTSSVDPDTATDAELVRLVRRAAGEPLPVEVLSHRPWTAGAALVAESFGTGRVRLAGDAAHLFTPNGGFGMNTGVDDAANLAWKLAAAVRGWAGPHLLDTYGVERRPIALRNTSAARTLGQGLGAVERPASLEEDSAAGEAARAKTGAELAEYGMRTLDTLGVQLGARYDGSPIVDGDGGGPVPDSFSVYTPSAAPGGRAPHLWLDDRRTQGSSLFDRLGPGFTLLRLGPRPPRTGRIEAAARARGVPLRVLTLGDPLARELYERDLVLVRPDQHVAWRADREPGDPEALLALVTGGPHGKAAGPSPATARGRR